MKMGLGRMQADPHANHARGKKCTLHGYSRRDGIERTLEADEKRVPLGIDFASMMSLKHLTQHATVLRTQVTVCDAVPP